MNTTTTSRTHNTKSLSSRSNSDPNDSDDDFIFSDSDDEFTRTIKEAYITTSQQATNDIRSKHKRALQQVTEQSLNINKLKSLCSFKWKTGPLKRQRCSEPRWKGPHCKTHHDTARRREKREEKQKNKSTTITQLRNEPAGAIPRPLTLEDLNITPLTPTNQEKDDSSYEQRFHLLTGKPLTIPELASTSTSTKDADADVDVDGDISMTDLSALCKTPLTPEERQRRLDQIEKKEKEAEQKLEQQLIQEIQQRQQKRTQT